ncbi:Nucleoside ABC transporter, periplasmic nucleoside-binding protein [Caballeronia glathei]|uniref:MlaA family lipoprotein n=1 Tax=Caballeronia glathei TaxID=60547 RepID=UPI00050143D0|nr:VacJ family lipoprotein [Caballeronia glathei]CDY75091.1 Nucleoside ABC transporter, periplasmic nucleoside-binding protein [Caballeronia glathei]
MKTALAAGNFRTLGVSVAMAGLLATAGCATGPDRRPGDPLEPMNRAIFSFNDGLDKYIARPVAQAYVNVTPSPFRTAVSNFFSNLGDIGNFANNLLQLKITDATQDLVRFAFNSTFGIGGLIDIASQAGLPKHHQDFGLTLGHYGVPSGPYLVLPVFGPSSFRDATNWLVAFRLDPITYMDPAVRNILFGVNFVSARADLIGATDILSQAALDKYAFVRDAYTQRRQYLLTGGTGTSLPDYGDDTGDGAAAPEGASAPGGTGGGSQEQGLPTYDDPGAAPSGPAPATPPAPGASPGAAPSPSSSEGAGLPKYEDPAPAGK